MKKYFLFVISTFLMGLGILSATGCDSDATITPQTRNAYSKVNLSDWQMQKCDYLEGMACPFQLLKREYEGETYYWYSSTVFSNIFEHLYDSKGNLIRQDCTATNKLPDLSAVRGQRVLLNMTVNPTYLYVLSEPDLDNPTIKIN